jgi:hypothetical protein
MYPLGNVLTYLVLFTVLKLDYVRYPKAQTDLPVGDDIEKYRLAKKAILESRNTTTK